MRLSGAALARAGAEIGTLAGVVAAAHLLTGPAQTYAQLAALVLGGSAIYGAHAATLTPTPAPPDTPTPGLGALMSFMVQLSGSLDTADAEQALVNKLAQLVADPANGVTASAASFPHLGQVNLSAPEAPATPAEQYDAAEQALKDALTAGDIAAARTAYADVQTALAALEASAAPAAAPAAPASPVAL